MRYFLIFLLFLLPIVCHSQELLPNSIDIFSPDITDAPRHPNSRVTFGWTAYPFKGYFTNMVQANIKLNNQKSMFTFAFGASISKLNYSTIIEDDLDSPILDLIGVDYPEKFKVEKVTKSKLYIGAASYQMFHTFYENSWKELNWSIYGSTGVIGQWYGQQEQNTYNIIVQLDDKHSTSDSVTNPMNFVHDEFSLVIPACMNADINFVTMGLCGLLYTNSPLDSRGTLTVQFGI